MWAFLLPSDELLTFISPRSRQGGDDLWFDGKLKLMLLAALGAICRHPPIHLPIAIALRDVDPSGQIKRREQYRGLTAGTFPPVDWRAEFGRTAGWGIGLHDMAPQNQSRKRTNVLF
jgi:hypothetical protein